MLSHQTVRSVRPENKIICFRCITENPTFGQKLGLLLQVLIFMKSFCSSGLFWFKMLYNKCCSVRIKVSTEIVQPGFDKGKRNSLTSLQKNCYILKLLDISSSWNEQIEMDGGQQFVFLFKPMNSFFFSDKTFRFFRPLFTIETSHIIGTYF